jgi:hypothetical protein
MVRGAASRLLGMVLAAALVAPATLALACAPAGGGDAMACCRTAAMACQPQAQVNAMHCCQRMTTPAAPAISSGPVLVLPAAAGLAPMSAPTAYNRARLSRAHGSPPQPRAGARTLRI